jgi:hypothetical protein
MSNHTESTGALWVASAVNLVPSAVLAKHARVAGAVNKLISELLDNSKLASNSKLSCLGCLPRTLFFLSRSEGFGVLAIDVWATRRLSIVALKVMPNCAASSNSWRPEGRNRRGRTGKGLEEDHLLVTQVRFSRPESDHNDIYNIKQMMGAGRKGGALLNTVHVSYVIKKENLRTEFRRALDARCT